MNTKRYHHKIGFPSTYRRPVGTWRLTPSRHAIEQSRRKGFELPESVNLNHGKIVEVSMKGQKIVKIVFRTHYSVTHDIAIVIDFSSVRVTGIRTAWLNKKNDEHATLRHEEYDRP